MTLTPERREALEEMVNASDLYHADDCDCDVCKYLLVIRAMLSESERPAFTKEEVECVRKIAAKSEWFHPTMKEGDFLERIAEKMEQ